MVFSSIVFLLYFFPLFFLAYYLCPDKFKNYLILAASIVFYSWGAPRFIFVILSTTFIDFLLVKWMDKSTSEYRRKTLMTISVCMNVGLLFYFKYSNFFIENFNSIFSLVGMKHLRLLDVVLPIGISFYTFETITYVIDVYRREHKPLTNFLNYQLYIILFPKLIAGPIVRYVQIADQITDRFATFSYSNALKGFHRFVIGLCKKVIIANTFGGYADKIYNADPHNISAWLACQGLFHTPCKSILISQGIPIWQ